jgi:hypothetical protein
MAVLLGHQFGNYTRVFVASHVVPLIQGPSDIKPAQRRAVQPHGHNLKKENSQSIGTYLKTLTTLRELCYIDLSHHAPVNIANVMS